MWRIFSFPFGSSNTHMHTLHRHTHTHTTKLHCRVCCRRRRRCPHTVVGDIVFCVCECVTTFFSIVRSNLTPNACHAFIHFIHVVMTTIEGSYSIRQCQTIHNACLCNVKFRSNHPHTQMRRAVDQIILIKHSSGNNRPTN